MGTMSHESSPEPRLTQGLRLLLARQRVAALATLDAEGRPFASMVPFALDRDTGHLVIHVSGLAPHTANLLRTPQVSVLIMQSEVVGEPVHALPRVSLEGVATALAPQEAAWDSGRAAYLARFPEAEPMTQLGDFRFVGITIHAARQVAGFGAARTLDAADLQQVLRSPA